MRVSELLYTSYEEDATAQNASAPWKVLVVDDEPDVLRVTEMVLKDLEHAGRRVELLQAESAAAAKALLGKHHDIALALIDVVMESKHAGLELVDYIRKDLGNGLMRIVLRTGQPGEAPERQVVEHYRVDDYRHKAALTADQLLTVVRTGLNTYGAMTHLTRTYQELERVKNDLEQFTAIVAHDLQGPLRQVGSFSTVLRRKYVSSLDADALKLLDFIESGVSRMSRLIQDLMCLSRVGHEAVDIRAVDCSVAAANAVENLRSLIDERGAEVSIEDLPTINGVESYLTLVFQNLIANGIKFNRADVPTVRISADETDTGWCIVVQDNGIGVAADEAEAVFKPFHRGRSGAGVPGTGIGLATCRRMVEYHGGEIRLVPQAEGARFEIRLPRHGASPPEHAD